MSSTSIQLSFALKASSKVKTVHLSGSWDNYSSQLPLSRSDASKSGTFRGAFKFQNTVLKPEQRYWYYYLVDGYHCVHDPSIDATKEPTTSRMLNILDVPKSKAGTKSSKSSSSSPKSTSTSTSKTSSKSAPPRISTSKHSSSSSKHVSIESGPLKGRPLSLSQLKHPRPQKPHESAKIRTSEWDSPISPTAPCYSPTLSSSGAAPQTHTVQQLTSRFSAATLDDSDDSESDSEDESDCGSLTSDDSVSTGSGYSTPSSSVCSCERYAITRAGERVKLDCGGRRCSYSGDDSSCSSSDSEVEQTSRNKGGARMPTTRRYGVHIRK